MGKEMLSIKEGLHFDVSRAANEIEQFVRSEVHRLGKCGMAAVQKAMSIARLRERLPSMLPLSP